MTTGSCSGNATSAATLVGLLFVAMSVSNGRSQAHPQLIREFRAAAALLAFTNPFTVSLFGLVPGTNIGYPAAIVGVIGVTFAAAGVRATISLPSRLGHRGPQATLILALLVVFGLQIVFWGRTHPFAHMDVGALANVGYVLVASLLIGIGRAWELVGEWNTGLFSICRSLDRPPSPATGTDRPRTRIRGFAVRTRIRQGVAEMGNEEHGTDFSPRLMSLLEPLAFAGDCVPLGRAWSVTRTPSWRRSRPCSASRRRATRRSWIWWPSRSVVGISCLSSTTRFLATSPGAVAIDEEVALTVSDGA